MIIRYDVLGKTLGQQWVWTSHWRIVPPGQRDERMPDVFRPFLLSQEGARIGGWAQYLCDGDTVESHRVSLHTEFSFDRQTLTRPVSLTGIIDDFPVAPFVSVVVRKLPQGPPPQVNHAFRGRNLYGRSYFPSVGSRAIVDGGVSLEPAQGAALEQLFVTYENAYSITLRDAFVGEGIRVPSYIVQCIPVVASRRKIALNSFDYASQPYRYRRDAFRLGCLRSRQVGHGR